MSLILNSVKCNACGMIISSVYRREVKVCKCGKVKICGGFRKLQRYSPQEAYTELSKTTGDDLQQYIEEIKDAVEVKETT
jgi:hypothetical protein